MGAAIGDILGLAAGVAVSPLPMPIVAMILLLATPRGRADGLLFGVGWLVGLAVLGAVVLALQLALRQWRARPAEGAEPEMPRWIASLDRLRPGGALGLGALLSAVNPKNGGLTIAAAATAGPGCPAVTRRSSWPCSCSSGPLACSRPWSSTSSPGRMRQGPSTPGGPGRPPTTRP
jgi:hypothetical protein